MNWEVVWYLLMLAALFLSPIVAVYLLYYVCYVLPKKLEEETKDENLGV